MIYNGSCKCGVVNYAFISEKTKKDIIPRTDRKVCSFCDTNEGVWISDSNGILELNSNDNIEVKKFGEETVEFCICKECGELVYALYRDADGNIYGANTIQTLEGFRIYVGEIIDTNFRSESKEESDLRRKQNWTPVKFI